MILFPLVSWASTKWIMYCLCAIFLSFFLTPQQTKYFGGLAIQLKYVGLFSKYQTSENFVSVFSWVLIFLFFVLSFLLS